MAESPLPVVNPPVPGCCGNVRWLSGSLILLIGGGAATYFWLNRGANSGMETVLALALGLVTAIAFSVWLVFFSRLPKQVRLLSAAVIGLLLIGFVGLFRFEKFYGDMFPMFVYRWTPTSDAKLQEFVQNQSKSPATEATTTALVTTEHDYPAFLGKDRLGMIPGTQLARDWAKEPPKELWRHPVGLGWSAFAIVGDLAFTQEQRGPDEAVVCYELKTGKQVWVHSDQTLFAETLGGNGPRATPTFHNGKLYTYGATGILNCLDAATGKLVWTQKTLANASDNITWGMCASPLIYDNLVVVSPGAKPDHSLVAYDVETGKEAWHTGDERTAYSSPQLATLCGERQVLNFAGPGLAGHDPLTGKKLWEFPWVTNGSEMINTTQPLVLTDFNSSLGPDLVFISTGYGKGCALLQISKGEQGFKVEPKWESRNMKSKFSNLIIRDHYVYGLDEGMLSCVDLNDGKRVWKKRGSYGHGQLLWVGDLLLIQAESGSVYLVEVSSKEPVELGEIPALSSKTWNNLALSGNVLLVRNDVEAACYELPLAQPATPAESTAAK